MKKFPTIIYLFAASLLLCSCSHRDRLAHSVALPIISDARLLKETSGPYIEVTGKMAEPTPDTTNDFCYKLKPQNFRPGDHYYGYRFNANYQQHGLGEFVVNEDGDLFWKTFGVTVSGIESHCTGFLNGEQWYHILVSEDGQQPIVTIINPDPIEYRWEDGAYVSVSLLDQKQWDFLLAGKGFKPNEKMVLTFKDNDVGGDANVKSNDKGVLIVFLPPLSPNKGNERATLTIKRHQATEIPTLTYLYGRAAFVKALPNKYPTVDSVNPEDFNKSHPPYMLVALPKKPSS